MDPQTLHLVPLGEVAACDRESDWHLQIPSYSLAISLAPAGGNVLSILALDAYTNDRPITTPENVSPTRAHPHVSYVINTPPAHSR